MDEVKEFHPMVKEHSIEIFGSNTRFVDISPRLLSEAKIDSEPDGFVIDPINSTLYLIEVELSKHSPYKHINDQLTRFINGLDNLRTKNIVAEALFDEIEKDKELSSYFEEKVKENLYGWLQRLVSNPPTIIVVIEEKTPEVLEACRVLMRSYDTRILEFKTFKREDASTIHAHLFETLISEEKNSNNNTDFGDLESRKANQPVKQIAKIEPTEDYHLQNADKDIRAAYQSIKNGVLGFDSTVRINPQKHYISLRRNKNFAYIDIKKKRMNIVLSCLLKELDD